MVKYKSPQNQSKGILDDFAVRKNVATREGTIEKTPVDNNDIVNKAYVDSLSIWDASGADTTLVVAEDINMQTKKITNLVDPTTNQEGATKKYVDDNSFQSGMIMLWSGAIANIPTGWLICDGTNSTPDLRDRFVIGAGSTYNPDATGGSNSHSHSDSFTIDNENSHTHQGANILVNSTPAHTHSISILSGNPSVTQSIITDLGITIIPTYKHKHQVTGTSASGGGHTHTLTGNSGVGGGHNHGVSGSVTSATTLPPYYALAFIMKS